MHKNLTPARLSRSRWHTKYTLHTDEYYRNYGENVHTTLGIRMTYTVCVRLRNSSPRMQWYNIIELNTINRYISKPWIRLFDLCSCINVVVNLLKFILLAVRPEWVLRSASFPSGIPLSLAHLVTFSLRPAVILIANENRRTYAHMLDIRRTNALSTAKMHTSCVWHNNSSA